MDEERETEGARTRAPDASTRDVAFSFSNSSYPNVSRLPPSVRDMDYLKRSSLGAHAPSPAPSTPPMYTYASSSSRPSRGARAASCSANPASSSAARAPDRPRPPEEGPPGFDGVGVHRLERRPRAGSIHPPRVALAESVETTTDVIYTRRAFRPTRFLRLAPRGFFFEHLRHERLHSRVELRERLRPGPRRHRPRHPRGVLRREHPHRQNPRAVADVAQLLHRVFRGHRRERRDARARARRRARPTRDPRTERPRDRRTAPSRPTRISADRSPTDAAAVSADAFFASFPRRAREGTYAAEARDRAIPASSARSSGSRWSADDVPRRVEGPRDEGPREALALGRRVVSPVAAASTSSPSPSS